MAETIRLEGLENEFRLNAEAKAKSVIDEHLRTIVRKIRSLVKATDQKGVEESLEELGKLNNGVYLLEQVLQNNTPFYNTYELEYVDLEVFGENETGVATRQGQDVVDGTLHTDQLDFSADEIKKIKVKIVRYAMNTTESIFTIPLISLIKQFYNFQTFDTSVTDLIKKNLLGKYTLSGNASPQSAKEVEIFNLLGPEHGEISEELFAKLNLTDPAFFPEESLKNNLTEEFVGKYLKDSLASSVIKIDPADVSSNWLDKLGSFLTSFSRSNKFVNISTKLENDYYKFIEKVIEDSENIFEEPNDSSLLEKFEETIDISVNSNMVMDGELIDLLDSGLYSIVARFIENARREQLVEDRRDFDEFPDPDSEGFQKTLDDIEKKALGELSGSPLGEEGEKELTEEDIKNRQRFFKQCALMMNLPQLAKSYQKIIKNRIQKTMAAQSAQSRGSVTCQTFSRKFNNVPFDGRLYMVSNPDNQSATLSKMLNSDVAKELFNIPPSVLSSLVPKIKLFRVQNDEKKAVKTEFVFETSEDLNRERNFEKTINFFDSQFDKGSGVGLKNFSFEFNGTNPAESRKDIKATLQLHFQSFGDFVAERIGYNGEKYRFVDLILHPPKDEKEIIHRNQYSPSYYRIMAEVGYHIPKKSDLEVMFPWYNKAEQLVESLVRTNKSFYLCMIDHDFQINVDGTVNLNITYGAYVETILKTHQYDALATPEIVENRKQIFKNFIDIVNKRNCTQEELQRYRSALDAQQQIFREKSLQSIIKRLLDREKIFVCEISSEQASSYRTLGFFKDKPVLTGLKTKTEDVTQEDAIQQGDTLQEEKTEIILNQVALPDGYNYNSPNDNTIQYFYFGDLLHTILDTMYKKEDPTVLREEVENCRFILGSFDFDVYKDASGLNHTINIAQIPISVEYFADWFTNNVIKKGSTRKTFPIITFIRNLSSNLLQQSLLESCVNRRLDKNYSFQTGQITAYNEGASGKNSRDPLRKVFDNKSQQPVIQIQSHRTNTSGSSGGRIFPFKGDTVSEVKDISNYHNYIYLGVLGSSLSTNGNGKYAADNKNGMYHIEIGNNKGIVKSVNFAKTDMQFVREARFFQQGIDGLLQLSTVYKVTIEMFGNTIFYPGMDLYLNPYGIGGDKLGSPTQGPFAPGGERSLANKLGIGGYHTVTSVKSSIGVSGFKTTIEAQMYYAGDGSTSYVSNGAPNGQNVPSISKAKGRANTKNSVECENVIIAVESDLNLVEQNQSPYYLSNISDTMETSNRVSSNASDAIDAELDSLYGQESDPDNPGSSTP
tara:strand:- start:2346 stop:6209 length:3864 start_codon:yes stop_codon:yes gene_type:complete